MAVTPEGSGIIEYYVLKDGQPNLIPENIWPFPQIPRFPRVLEPGSMPWAGWPWTTCPDDEDWAASKGYPVKDNDCDWWREKYHRGASWQMTAIVRLLTEARAAIPQVGDFDTPQQLSKTTFLGEYVMPLCLALNAFNEYIQQKHFRNRFNYGHGNPDCKGFGQRCANGYYPVQYWEDLEVAACIELQDILNRLENHLIDLQIDKGANKTPEQIWLAFKGAKQKKDVFIGQKQEWIADYKAAGGSTAWTPKKIKEGYAGTDTTAKDEEKSALDALLEKELLNPDSGPAPINWLLVGGAALALVLLTRRKK